MKYAQIVTSRGGIVGHSGCYDALIVLIFLLEGYHVTLSEMMSISLLLEGQMLDIESVIFSECTHILVRRISCYFE